MRRLAILCVVLAACTNEVGVDTDEGDEAQDDPIAAEDPTDVVVGELPAAAPGQLRVVQMNPYYAGRLAPYTEHQSSCSATSQCQVSGRTACTSTSQSGCWECIDHACRNRDWESMTSAAGLYAAIGADVVGIEELDPRFAAKIDSILESKTAKTWDYRVAQQGINNAGSGIGVYWRTDRVELVKDLGSVVVDTLTSENYSVRFHGAILADKRSGKQFGFFSGKLVWGSGGDDADRQREAQRLRAWIDAQMAANPLAKARIVASDFNDTVGSGAYNVFKTYDDGDARKATSHAADPQERIDYLFWADSAAGASRDGFVTARSDGRLGRSEYYGSDHRFVYGDALIP